ncbi:MAG: arginase [Bacteroidetes bacterium]|nr:arginase [Bacteroidota bacterium]
MKKETEIILLCSEFGCGKRGASLGPEAVMIEDFERKGNFFKNNSISIVKEQYSESDNSSKYNWAKNIDKISKYLSKVVKTIEKSIAENHFPLIISGDHSNAIGSVSAIKNSYYNKRIGVIWIDAHADLHSPHTTPSGNLHGMALGALLGDNDVSEKEREININTQNLWNKLLKLGSKSIYPKILPQDLVFIGLRDYEQAEINKIVKNNIKYFSPENLKQIGIKSIAHETIEYLKNCDLIYISFDVDSLDPKESEGTGTPAQNGLTLLQAKQLMQILCKSPKLVAIEFTEINPLADTKNKMAKNVLEIIDEIFI